MTVSAIIPARNEAARIAETLESLKMVAGIDQIIVVDDGSIDDTASVAEAHGADVLRLPRSQGKGGAMNAGVRASHGEALLFLDADLGRSSEEASLLLGPVIAGDADMTIAEFTASGRKGGGFGLVVGLARAGIHSLTGRTMRAPISGQRALKREVWEKVGGIAPGFGAEVALTVDAIKAGFRVLEVPTKMTHRVTGNDWQGIRHRARQFAHVARALLKRRPIT
jgi:glycosyltransferase involved in cell wall biosynthesis